MTDKNCWVLLFINFGVLGSQLLILYAQHQQGKINQLVVKRFELVWEAIKLTQNQIDLREMKK